MRSLPELQREKRYLEGELERITIRGTITTPWAPGVHDQFKVNEYSTVKYTDETKARELKNKISRLEDQIETYAQDARRERQEKQTETYTYKTKDGIKKTNNPAEAARYNAQKRFFGMNKLQKVMAKITLQESKFHQLWTKALTANESEQEKIASELDRMFR